ncbi:unnamed protein product, partial [Musa textilis]
ITPHLASGKEGGRAFTDFSIGRARSGKTRPRPSCRNQARDAPRVFPNSESRPGTLGLRQLNRAI